MAQRWKRFETDTSESRLRRELEDLEEKVCWLSQCPFASCKPSSMKSKMSSPARALSGTTELL